MQNEPQHSAQPESAPPEPPLGTVPEAQDGAPPKGASSHQLTRQSSSAQVLHEAPQVPFAQHDVCIDGFKAQHAQQEVTGVGQSQQEVAAATAEPQPAEQGLDEHMKEARHEHGEHLALPGAGQQTAQSLEVVMADEDETQLSAEDGRQAQAAQHQGSTEASQGLSAQQGSGGGGSEPPEAQQDPEQSELENSQHQQGTVMLEAQADQQSSGNGQFEAQHAQQGADSAMLETQHAQQDIDSCRQATQPAKQASDGDATEAQHVQPGTDTNLLKSQQVASNSAAEEVSLCPRSSRRLGQSAEDPNCVEAAAEPAVEDTLGASQSAATKPKSSPKTHVKQGDDEEAADSGLPDLPSVADASAPALQAKPDADIQDQQQQDQAQQQQQQAVKSIQADDAPLAPKRSHKKKLKGSHKQRAASGSQAQAKAAPASVDKGTTEAVGKGITGSKSAGKVLQKAQEMPAAPGITTAVATPAAAAAQRRRTRHSGMAVVEPLPDPDNMLRAEAKTLLACLPDAPFVHTNQEADERHSSQAGASRSQEQQPSGSKPVPVDCAASKRSSSSGLKSSQRQPQHKTGSRLRQRSQADDPQDQPEEGPSGQLQQPDVLAHAEAKPEAENAPSQQRRSSRRLTQSHDASLSLGEQALFHAQSRHGTSLKSSGPPTDAAPNASDVQQDLGKASAAQAVDVSQRVAKGKRKRSMVEALLPEDNNTLPATTAKLGHASDSKAGKAKDTRR